MSAYRDERVYLPVDRDEVEAWVRSAREWDPEEEHIIQRVISIIVHAEGREAQTEEKRYRTIKWARERDALGRAIYEHGGPTARREKPWEGLTADEKDGWALRASRVTGDMRDWEDAEREKARSATEREESKQ